MNVGLVEEACALGLGQNEVGEEEEAEVGVKRKPRKTRSQIWLWAIGKEEIYHERMNQVQDSAREKQDRTTQYMSHGVNWAGSEVRRAL